MKAATAPDARPNTPSTGSAQVIVWPLDPVRARGIASREAADIEPPALAMQLARRRAGPAGGRWYGLAGTG